MNEIKLKIEFLSDWAFFTGKSNGVVDNTIIRDENEFPYIPGRTIKGIFREAFEEIKPILYDNMQNDIIYALFGKEKEKKNENKNSGSLIFADATLDENFINEINKLSKNEKKMILSEAVYNVPRICIDKETNMTKERALAIIELGRKGITFYTSIKKVNNEEFTDEENKIIKYCCGYIKRMGALRTRGKGKCKIEIINKEVENGSRN